MGLLGRSLVVGANVEDGRPTRWVHLFVDDPVGGETVAYHSSNPSDPDVYHESDSCPTGQQIPVKNRVPGRGSGNRPCKQCAS